MLEIDLDADEPLFAQVVRGLRDAISRRDVRVGDRLPSVRQLAGDLGIHLNTVARAYRRLEEDGLVRVRHGQGVVVVSERVEADRAGAADALERALRAAFSEARLAGLPDAEALQVVRKVVGGGGRGAAAPPAMRPAAGSKVGAASAPVGAGSGSKAAPRPGRGGTP